MTSPHATVLARAATATSMRRTAFTEHIAASLSRVKIWIDHHFDLAAADAMPASFAGHAPVPDHLGMG